MSAWLARGGRALDPVVRRASLSYCRPKAPRRRRRCRRAAAAVAAAAVAPTGESEWEEAGGPRPWTRTADPPPEHTAPGEFDENGNGQAVGNLGGNMWVVQWETLEPSGKADWR